MVQTIENVDDVFEVIFTALRTLHGRLVYDMFGLYLQELKHDIRDLIDASLITPELKPTFLGDSLVLPNFTKSSPKRMRHMWDYFVFIYMSHKIQNIKRRQHNLDMRTLLYLRGSDYEFTLAQDGLAVSSSTASDMHFQIHLLHELKKRFNVLKALSPTDLHWIMMDLGPYLIATGNALHSVAEFARSRNEGVYLSGKAWKDAVLDLLPSAHVFLVYVSNRSKGLEYELKSLLNTNLETHSVLVLARERSTARKSFYGTQDDLKAGGSELLFSVPRGMSDVDDPEEFERLLERFPFRVEIPKNEAESSDRIVSLLESVGREPQSQPTEIPFKFEVELQPDDEKKVDNFRQFISQQINAAFSSSHVSNWPALLLFVELDTFLNLCFGKICDAAISTARYAGLADVSARYLERKAPELFKEVRFAFEQHRNMAMNVALDSLAFGEWNDYRNRLVVSRELVDRISRETRSLFCESLNASRRSVIQMPRSTNSEADRTAEHSDLFRRVIDSQIRSEEVNK